MGGVAWRGTECSAPLLEAHVHSHLLKPTPHPSLVTQALPPTPAATYQDLVVVLRALAAQEHGQEAQAHKRCPSSHIPQQQHDDDDDEGSEETNDLSVVDGREERVSVL